MTEADQWNVLGQVLVAMLLAGMLGLERELVNKPAGLRTQMLVAGAAVVLIALGDALLQHYDQESNALVRSDPIRVIEAIITGVSFLGAGTIFRRNDADVVEGLTTAAALLFSCAIGICVGVGALPLACGITVTAVAVLRGGMLLERHLPAGSRKSQSEQSEE